MRAYLLALAVIVAGCGEDEAPAPAPRPPAPRPAGGGGKGGPAAKKGKGKQLKPMARIEDRVACPTPSDAKKCDPKAPTCGVGQYCIAAGNDHYCGPCPERDAIRHAFKPRDFQGEDIRDPFLSYVIMQPGLVGPEGKVTTEPTQQCTRKDQFVATSANYQSLKLIGIVSQGTQRKVLLSDGRLGHIVKKGDCVGKEKAIVKDIGAGYITFAVAAAGKTEPAEYSMQLYPTQVSLGMPDVIDPGAASSVPLVAPPTAAPAAPEQPAPQQGGTTTTIIQDKPQVQTIPPPPSAPVQLKP